MLFRRDAMHSAWYESQRNQLVQCGSDGSQLVRSGFETSEHDQRENRRSELQIRSNGRLDRCLWTKIREHGAFQAKRKKPTVVEVLGEVKLSGRRGVEDL